MAVRDVELWGITEESQSTDADGFPETVPTRKWPIRMRETLAALKRWITDAIQGSVETTGTATAYELAVTASPLNRAAGPPLGAVFRFRLHVATGAAPTLKVGDLSTARPLKTPGDAAVGEGWFAQHTVLTVQTLADAYEILSPDCSPAADWEAEEGHRLRILNVPEDLEGLSLSNADPLPAGAAVPGTSRAASRRDHRHPQDLFNFEKMHVLD